MEWLEMAPVVSGSYTPEQRDSSHGNSVWPDTTADFRSVAGGLNNYEMLNMGFAAAVNNFEFMPQPAHPMVVSIAGFSIKDYLAGLKQFSGLPGVSAIELNFGCSNLLGEAPEIMSFRFNVIRKLLDNIVSYELRTKPIWLKFSPYSNPAELQRVAELINEHAHQLSLAVVTCNPFPYANFGAEKNCINAGMSGLSGAILKPIALDQVRQFRQCLDTSVDVIGVGGVTTGDDIMDFLEAGAAIAQITSMVHMAGSRNTFLHRLLEEATASRFIAHLNIEEERVVK
jgi:dihydroorotate dehydrogenase (fumarate)